MSLNAINKKTDFFIAEMEIIEEGRNFRRIYDHELPRLMESLEKYLPYALKVCFFTAGIY